MKFFFSFLLICAAFSASAQAPQLKFARITDTADHYSIMVPQGWRYLTNPEHGGFEAWKPNPANPEQGDEVASLAIINLNFSLADLVKAELEQQIKSNKAEVKDSATSVFGDRKLFVGLFYYTLPETNEAWQSVVVLRIPEPGRCFVFEGSGPQTNPYLLSIFKNMGASITTDEEVKRLKATTR